MCAIMVRFNSPRRIRGIYVKCIQMSTDAFHGSKVLDHPGCGLEGTPQLMGSFKNDQMLEKVHPQGKKGLLTDRDKRFGADYEANASSRRDLEEPEIHPGKSSLA